jgi:chitin synthase
MIINKVGNPDEIVKKGNRGKRDSQVILMSFFSKILYGDRLSDLDFEIYRKMLELFPLFKPEDFEILLMVDADTIVKEDALIKIVSAFEKDPKIMGLCGETQILNKGESFITQIQVFEYYISHHLAKNFESVFGGVTCLPGCFCTYRIKITTDSMGNIKNHSDKKLNLSEDWACVPLLANPLIINAYSVYEAKTLHEQNLLHLGEDRYLTTLLMKNFYKRKLVFIPSAKCSTYVPADYATLRSQRRRWINSTIHNMFELVCVDKLCGTHCFSMQFTIAFELFGTLTLPAAIFFTIILVVSAFLYEPAWIPLIMLAAILGLPAVLIMVTTFEIQYIYWLLVYIIALPIWNFFLPVYAFWRFDDFSWGDTRKIDEQEAVDEIGTFDASSVRFKHLQEHLEEHQIT